jgi:dTDP-4-amino-4,6-dideoxygalactose transaminase
MRSDLPVLLGGAPVRPEGPSAWPIPDPDVRAALAAAAESGTWGQYHGEHVCELETELAAFHGVPHAITCASGTLAVEVALRALRVGPGDEVVMSAYDYEPTFLTIHALGAKPVLVDVHPANWQLDPTKLEAAFTVQTKAVICSHLHGGLVPMSAVMGLARARGICVVEDAAQASGATVEGRPAGTWGDVGTLSFGGSKLLVAGRGGAVLFADPNLHQRAKSWLHRGIQQWAPISELQAAALRPQLRKLKDSTRQRAERVRELLAGAAAPGLVPFGNMLPDSAPAFYKVGFQYDPASFGLSREMFVRALRAEGIAFDPGFKALHVGRSPSRFRSAGELTHATDAHERCVCLYHPVLSGVTADVQQVAEAVAKVYRYRDQF